MGTGLCQPALRGLAAAQGVTDCTRDYVGQTPLAKGFGTRLIREAEVPAALHRSR